MKRKGLLLEGSTPKTKDKQVPGRWMPIIMASQPAPLTYPHKNKGFVRLFQGKPMVAKPLIKPSFWLGGYVTLGGSWLTRHNTKNDYGFWVSIDKSSTLRWQVKALANAKTFWSQNDRGYWQCIPRPLFFFGVVGNFSPQQKRQRCKLFSKVLEFHIYIYMHLCWIHVCWISIWKIDRPPQGDMWAPMEHSTQLRGAGGVENGAKRWVFWPSKNVQQPTGVACLLGLQIPWRCRDF